MEIIDNLNKLLGDDIKVMLTRGSKLRIAASTFSIDAFEALRKELEGVKELESILTAPTFTASQATDEVKKERREFHIPPTKRESSLYGSEFEIRLRNRYASHGILQRGAGPGENPDGTLIVTVNGSNGSISAAEIEQLVDEVFMGGCS